MRNLALGLLLVAGAATAPFFSPALEAGQPVLLAAADWEKFARIRRGETTVDEEEAPLQPTPLPQPAPQPAAPPAGQAQPLPAQATPAPVSPQPTRPQPKAQPASGPNPSLIKAPKKPTESGSWWAFYEGRMAVAGNSWYDPHGIDFSWAYSRKNPLPDDPRIVVFMHGSGGGIGAMWAFGPSAKGDIEVRAQDAETYNQDWREWWSVSRDGVGYPGRRIAAALDFVSKRYDIDASTRGIVLEGPSMGGAGSVVQTMLLPDPWRARIAYVSGRVGIVMPRRVAQRSPGQYISQPPDRGADRAVWDSMDFAIQAASDPIVRGIHYRHSFSSNDQFSAGPQGNTQVEFVNLVEKHRIGGAFNWVLADHSNYENGVKLPDLANFETPDQDITLDRAHPAFTNSTGNYPKTPQARADEQKFPRGHYNMGLHWRHAGIVDEPDQVVFPIRYIQRTGIGKGVPDQPRRITVSVTPRRPRNFAPVDGETLRWTWGKNELRGEVVVQGDTVTVDGIPLVSEAPYKRLRIYRP